MCLAIAINVNEVHRYIQKAREELWRKGEWILDFETKYMNLTFNIDLYWDLTGCRQKLISSNISFLRMRSYCSHFEPRARFMRSWKRQEGRGQVQTHHYFYALSPCNPSITKYHLVKGQ